jgi:hypothetical protein
MPDIPDDNWSERDERNAENAPNGFPPGLPAQIELIGQMLMGAIKRFWNKINPAYATTGTGDNYVVTPEGNTVFLNLYEIIRVRIDRANTTATPTLKFGRTSARVIVKVSTSGIVPLIAGDLIAGQDHSFWYNGTNFVLSNPGTVDSSVTVGLLKASNNLSDVLSASTSLSNIGGMAKSTYDPNNINADAFARANHTGTQAISTVSGLQTALDAKAALGAVNRFTATQQWAKGADIASAAALPIGTDGNFFHVTGTTGITSISTQPAGTQICLEFTGILTITHNATNLILPNGANITTYAGYSATFISEGSGNWRLVNAIPPPPAAMTRQIFTASGTYTRPAGLVRAIVTCVGGGGGGGYARTSAGNSAAGAGGGAGGCSVSLLSAATIGASQTVTIGAGGAGGIGSGPTSPVAGTDTSFGSLVIAKGGGAGGLAAATASSGAADGGAGGLASAGTGDVRSNGCPGNHCAVITGSASVAFPGNGGASLYGGAGQGISDGTGTAGTLGGGGGGVSATNGAIRNGGAGGSGIVIVDEYY